VKTGARVFQDVGPCADEDVDDDCRAENQCTVDDVEYSYHPIVVATPGFGAMRGTKVSGCLHEATVDIIVAVRLCISRSALKKS